MPLVSVIIPTWNASKFIDETLLSVLSQTMPELEIIIVDDGSTDDTVKIIQGLAQGDKRIRYFVQQKGGVSVARNRGIKEALGKHIAFIDHDDLWLPQKLEKQLGIFDKDPHLGLVYSRALIMGENGRPAGLVGGMATPRRGYVFRELLRDHFICLSTALIKRKVFDSLIEWFDESMEMAEEVDLFLRIAYNWKVDYCPDILARWRMHPNNDSRLRRRLLIKDYSRIIEKLKDLVPDFEKRYKKEVLQKRRWIATAEIEVLLSENKKNTAIKKSLGFLGDFGFYPPSIIKFFFLFILGFNMYDNLRRSLLSLYSKINA